MRSAPTHYFRRRGGGAVVFRITAESFQNRIAMERIATVDLESGEAVPAGGRTLSDADQAAIADWCTRTRQAPLTPASEALAALGAAADWAGGPAEPGELAEAREALLLAMHDLRTVLARRKE